MKYLIRLLLLVGLCFAVIALIGSMLPRNYSFTAAMDFDTPIEQVFEKFNRLPEWKNWSNWSPQRVDGLKVDYVGESGAGSAMTWNEARGEGKLWITGAKAPEWIEYKMTFANFPESKGRIELVTQIDGLTFVEWKMQGELPPGPFYGFWASHFASHMQYEFQHSLEQLKAIMEKEASAANEEDALETGDRKPVPMLDNSESGVTQSSSSN
jgi:hypothetical protein